MKNYLRFLAAVFSVNFKSAIEYKVNFFLQLFGMLLNNGAFILFWLSLLGHTGALGGYQFTDVMFLWSIGPAAFGLAHAFCGNISRLGTMIQQGELDVYLLQPKDPQLHALISRTDVSAWGDVLYAVLVISFLPGDGLKWGLFVLFSLSGAVIFTATYTLVHSLSFFWGGSLGIFRAFQEFLLSFSLYPEKIFPQGLRWVFYTIIPSGFLVFLPLEVFKQGDFWLIPVILSGTLGYLALSVVVFRWGLRKYESGNLVGTRL